MTTASVPEAATVPQGMPDRVGAVPTGPPAFTPYIPAEVTHLPEFTPRAVIIGTILGMIFGASSLYLVLKVGLTVSASIPVAVISITLFRILSTMGARNATILENNIVQTAGSAGESIAFGVGVTMPAILILGFDLEITRVMLVAVLGGLLGILMMIPLRRALIVAQHGLLKYPEGTACAEVLKAGASEESQAAASEQAKREQAAIGGAKIGAKTIFTGFGIGLVYKTAMAAFRLWKDVPEKVFGRPFAAGSVAAEVSPELLGVGYIIGPRIAGVMCAGGALTYLVLIPMIRYFGEGLTAPLAPSTAPTLIRDMSPGQIRNEYILYIGAGAVAAAGIISVFKSLPLIWHGIRGGMRDVASSRGAETRAVVPRTDNDLPIKVVLMGIVALIVVIAFANPLYVGGTGPLARLAAALLIVVFGFLFVTVSSRLTGEIGSTSNPISGMTVATLLLTCLVFVILGWTGSNYFVTALSIGAIVCIASSNGGTTSQDLKTGFLVGGTPRLQQSAILIGALVSALILGPILLVLNDSGSVYVPAGANTPANFTAGSADPNTTVNVDGLRRQGLTGPQSQSDPKEYFVWFHNPPGGGNAEKYLVDDGGRIAYYVDPGINGAFGTAPGGQRVTKFDAPKATLMSYIIKGILGGQLPWGLVILGAMIAVVLELAGISSLAFAVGVYLPLSSTTPILIGGIIRWAVDRWIRGTKYAGRSLTEDQLVAEGDKSPGVLMASGYIAGGAIAGIIFAFIQGVPFMAGFNAAIQAFAERNPMTTGEFADVLALIPFAILIIVLYLAGREKIMVPQRAD